MHFARSIAATKEVRGEQKLPRQVYRETMRTSNEASKAMSEGEKGLLNRQNKAGVAAKQARDGAQAQNLVALRDRRGAAAAEMGRGMA